MHHVGCSPGLLFLDQIQAHPFMRHKHSDYMHWSKTQSRARFNLATSGVAAFPPCELPVDLAKLEINGENSYGYASLQAAIAEHHSVDPECVVESAGTSMANHLAMAAIIEPGDEVLIEHPAYGPILDVAYYLEANVKRFRRAEEKGWVVDPAEVRRCTTPKTRLIVITNLHNPTSALTRDSVLREIGDIARSVGAFVLVDEVYLDAVYEDTPRTSFHLGPDFVARERGLSAVPTQWGTTSFARLRNGNVDAFLERLRSEFDTSAVPGRFFEMPDHFRIGMGVNTEMFAEGLSRIGRALASETTAKP